MIKCILPFADCPYRSSEQHCSDLLNGPYNSDAKCFRVSGKKKMLTRLKVKWTSPNLFPVLKVWTKRHDAPGQQRLLSIFIVNKKICTLFWAEPVLPDGESRWWLDNRPNLPSRPISMGFSELDAVNNVLRHFGYIK